MRLDDLRHSCVTLLLLGALPHIVHAIVGHADVHVTMTIYAHASLDDQRGRRLIGWPFCWLANRVLYLFLY